MNSQVQTSLLSPFHSVVGPSLLVYVKGDVVDPVQAEHVLKHMSPSLTCMAAQNRAFLKSSEAYKTIADSTALRGELKLALKMYRVLLGDIRMSPRYEHWMITEVPLYHASFLLAIDTLLTEAHICSKLQYREKFKRAVNFILGLLEVYREDPPDSFNLTTTHGCVVALIALGSGDSTSDVLPLNCFNLRWTSRATRQPDHMIDWVDEKMLSQTSEAFRMRVNVMQEHLMVRLTQFSDIDEAMRQRSS
jgi:hypothetical protein